MALRCLGCRYDAWLTIGISRYLALQYHKATFGNNEYRYIIRQVCERVRLGLYLLLHLHEGNKVAVL